LKNLPLTKRCLIGELKEHETTNNLSGIAAGIGGSVCVNHLWPVKANGGGMKDEALDLALETLESIQAAYPCETVGKRIAAIKQARLAPVQEPVAIPEYIRDAAKHLHENRFEPSFMVRAIVGWINGSPPAAQPAPVQEWMKPHPKCDEGCMYHCTKGYTQFPECATTPPAQPAPVQEPVAYLCENAVGHKYFRWKKPSSEFKPIALYTTPPAQPAPVQPMAHIVGEIDHAGKVWKPN
jgi:hypothetical protein